MLDFQSIKECQRMLSLRYWKRLGGVTYVLDEFHLSKYLTKITGHMLDTRQQAVKELCESIADGQKKDFNAIIDRLIDCAPNKQTQEKIKKESKYILSNWMAAKRRLQRKDSIVGCSAEGHVSHVLSARMSTLPMGWSRLGAAQMARLREWYYNGGDFLVLARYQQETACLEDAEEMEYPAKAVGEDVIYSASKMLLSEKTKRTKSEKEYGKYSERITHTWSAQIQKQVSFYAKH